MLTNPSAANDGLAMSRNIMPTYVLDRRVRTLDPDVSGKSRRDDEDLFPPDPRSMGVLITNAKDVLRSPFAWEDGAAETVCITGKDRVDIRFRAPVHLLVLHDKGSRNAGELWIEGLPVSTIRDFGRRLTFVRAGREYHEWIEPRSAVRLVYFYFDPSRLASVDGPGKVTHSRLFFEEELIVASMGKLRASLERPLLHDSGYLRALGTMLIYEVAMIDQPLNQNMHRGGLAPWQQRNVLAHIQEHLTEPVRLVALADLARLSTFHFCRAFKQTFGISPLRYHTRLRIEHAKDLLALRTEFDHEHRPHHRLQ